jgi:pyruvate formate lyase activating enzyme
MKIGGLQKVSLIDFPDRISCIIFTQGCNLRCPYCHNPELVIPENFSEIISEKDFFSFLQKRKKYLEGVSITGGEPCLQKDLLEFSEKIKNMGFAVKLDTNGCFPRIIKNASEKKLLDYIAMDVKAPAEKYNILVGKKIDTGKITKSIELIKNSGLPYEFKTTVVKSQLSFHDMGKIGEMIKGAKSYYLQKFIPSKTLDPSFMKETTYTDEEFEKIKKIMSDYAENVNVR